MHLEQPVAFNTSASTDQQPHGTNQHFSTPLPDGEKRVKFCVSYPFRVQRGGRHRVWIILFDGDGGEATNGDEGEGCFKR